MGEYCEGILIGPRQNFLNTLDKAKIKFEALTPEDKEDIFAAERKEYRNIGIALKQLLTLKDPDVAIIMKWRENEFVPRGDAVDVIQKDQDEKALLSKMLENVHAFLEFTSKYA